MLLLCLCLTSHQQLRSYGDGATSKSLIDRLVKPGIEPATPGLQGKRFIHYNTAAPRPSIWSECSSTSKLSECEATGRLSIVAGCCQTYLLDFFCSGIQFYVLLSPYLCFISFLNLDLYVRGDDALINCGSFMQTKHLCVLIYI